MDHGHDRKPCRREGREDHDCQYRDPHCALFQLFSQQKRMDHGRDRKHKYDQQIGNSYHADRRKHDNQLNTISQKFDHITCRREGREDHDCQYRDPHCAAGVSEYSGSRKKNDFI